MKRKMKTGLVDNMWSLRIVVLGDLFTFELNKIPNHYNKAVTAVYIQCDGMMPTLNEKDFRMVGNLNQEAAGLWKMDGALEASQDLRFKTWSNYRWDANSMLYPDTITQYVLIHYPALEVIYTKVEWNPYSFLWKWAATFNISESITTMLNKILVLDYQYLVSSIQITWIW